MNLYHVEFEGVIFGGDAFVFAASHTLAKRMVVTQLKEVKGWTTKPKVLICKKIKQNVGSRIVYLNDGDY